LETTKEIVSSRGKNNLPDYEESQSMKSFFWTLSAWASKPLIYLRHSNPIVRVQTAFSMNYVENPTHLK
jgi:hypothetical protein